MKGAQTITVFDENLKLVLTIYKNGDTKWDCSQKIISKWPKKFKERYADIVKFAADKYEEDPVIKLKRFFYARGIEEDQRLFQEIFRGLNLGIGKEEQIYIDKTIDMASDYFGLCFDDVRKDLFVQVA